LTNIIVVDKQQKLQNRVAHIATNRCCLCTEHGQNSHVQTICVLLISRDI